jgi:hypothetical protein
MEGGSRASLVVKAEELFPVHAPILCITRTDVGNAEIAEVKKLPVHSVHKKPLS